MLTELAVSLVVALLCVVVGAAGAALALSRLRRRPAGAEPAQVLAERVRAVGRLIGLEVCAREIATATRGWSGLPPLLLSPARLAMIFTFEKQYGIDLSRVGPGDVTALGGRRFRVRLPGIESQLRLTGVTPYDIQDGKLLGLIDVVPMHAEAQAGLMADAQRQAASLLERNDGRYRREARASVERHIEAFGSVLGVRIEPVWADEPEDGATTAREPAERDAALAVA